MTLGPAKKYGKCKSGQFIPRNPRKYKGDVSQIFYRSGLELQFMLECDRNPNIISWVSEEIVIPYLSPVDRKFHRYYPDFLIKVKTTEGVEESILVEIKPSSQVQAPTINKRRSKKAMLKEATTYAINEAKWKYAKEWCDDRNIKFKIITEKDIGYGKT